jgi:hypothetical protein
MFVLLFFNYVYEMGSTYAALVKCDDCLKENTHVTELQGELAGY